MSTDDELRLLLDERAIRRVLERLTRGGDRIEPALARECFWDDAYGAGPLFRDGLDEYFVKTAGYARGRPGGASTFTLLGQSLIDVDGDVAETETYLIYHRPMLGTGGVLAPVTEPEAGWRIDILACRYVTRFERRNGVWKIAHHVPIADWSLVTRGEQAFADIGEWLTGRPAPDDYTYWRKRQGDDPSVEPNTR